MTVKILQVAFNFRIIILLLTIVLSTQKALTKKSRILLPKNISPKHYNLSLTPNMTDFTFLGSVKIDLDVKEESDSIVFHAQDLDFKSILLRQKGLEKKIDVGKVAIDKKKTTAKIPVRVEKGVAKLDIKYSGEINDQMKGFYRSNYVKDGKTNFVGCTQFEAIDARRALPCWDEPSHKSTFELSIKVDKKYTVLSNTELVSETEGEDGLKESCFAVTPKMSTYLLAWFIGEYSTKTVKTKNGIAVSIHTPPGQLPKAERALEVARRALQFYEEYFGIKYPLKKLGMIALNDFVNGAMENWGLVTYRDTAIYSDENSSVRAREWVTIVVCHELAHQWFGNLVTMEWWTELWLNEGFATFTEALTGKNLFPEFGGWINFVNDKLENALMLDSLQKSHPIEVEIREASEIDEVFDAIAYEKGASLLRMLYEYIGENSFKKGVTNYLNHYKYGNADSNGLWSFLAESSGKDVGGFMNLYTKQQGYPLIECSLLSKKGDVQTIRLSQKRFFLSGKLPTKEEDLQWKIPISLSDANGKRWILMKSRELEIDVNPTKDGKVHINSGATGFFRTLYSPELLKPLLAAVAKNELAECDRFLLLSDLKSTFVAGKTSADTLLNVLNVFRGEKVQVVWETALNAIGMLRNVVRKTKVEDSMKKAAIHLTDEAMKWLGNEAREKDDALTRRLRASILNSRAQNGDKKAQNFFQRKFRELVEHGKNIDADIFPFVLNNAVRTGGEKEYETVRSLSKNQSDPAKKNNALAALGAAKLPFLAQRTLEMITSGEVRKQDTFYLFLSVSRNEHNYSVAGGRSAAWAFFKENYGRLRKDYESDSLFSTFVTAVADLKTDEAVADAESFFAGKDTKGYEKKLRQSLESAKMKISLRKREAENVKKWLTENGY